MATENNRVRMEVLGTSFSFSLSDDDNDDAQGANQLAKLLNQMSEVLINHKTCIQELDERSCMFSQVVLSLNERTKALEKRVMNIERTINAEEMLKHVTI